MTTQQAREALPQLRIDQPDDETAEFYFAGRHVGTATHDEHGWAGMAGMKRLAQAMCAALAALAEPAWRPIETAPKDGTHILVWTQASDTAYVVCWADAAKGIRKYLASESGAESGWHLAWDGTLFDREYSPTHWMPLPSPPTKEQQ